MITKIKRSLVGCFIVTLITFFSLLFIGVNAENATQDLFFPLDNDFNVNLLNSNSAKNFITLDYCNEEGIQKELFLDLDTDNKLKIQLENKILTVSDQKLISHTAEINYYKINNAVLISVEDNIQRYIYLLRIPKNIASADENSFKNKYFHELEAIYSSENITTNFISFSLYEQNNNLIIDGLDGNHKIFTSTIIDYQNHSYGLEKTTLNFTKKPLSQPIFNRILNTETKTILWKNSILKIFNSDNDTEIVSFTLPINESFTDITIVDDYIVTAQKQAAASTIKIRYIRLSDLTNSSSFQDLGNIETTDGKIKIYPAKEISLLIKYNDIAYKYDCDFSSSPASFRKKDYYGKQSQLKDDLNKLNEPKLISIENIQENKYVYIYDAHNRILLYKINKLNLIYEAQILKSDIQIKHMSTFNINNENHLIFTTLDNKVYMVNEQKMIETQLNIKENNSVIDLSNIIDYKYFENKLFLLYNNASVLEFKYLDFSTISAGEIQAKNINLSPLAIDATNDFIFDISANYIIHFLDKNTGTVQYYQLCQDSNLTYTAYSMNLSITDERLKNIESFRVNSLGDLYFAKLNNLFLLKRKNYKEFGNQTALSTDGLYTNISSFSISENGTICLSDKAEHVFAISHNKAVNLTPSLHVSFDNDTFVTIGKNKILKLENGTLLFRYPNDYSTAFVINNPKDSSALIINSTETHYFVVTKLGRFGFVLKKHDDIIINETSLDNTRFEEVNLVNPSSQVSENLSQMMPNLTLAPILIINENHKYNAYGNSSLYFSDFYNTYLKEYIENYKVKEWDKSFIPIKFEISKIFKDDTIWQTANTDEIQQPLMTRVRITNSAGEEKVFYGIYDEYTPLTSLSTHIVKEAKIQVSHIGKKVKLFASNNSNSQVLYELNDGNTVLILTRNYAESQAKFVKVSYKTKDNKEYIGYVYRDNLTTNRITSNQAKTIGIVLFSILLTVIQFSVLRYRHKRFDKDENL